AGVLDSGSAAHGPAGAVARRAERAGHAAGLSHQHPARPPHVAGNNDRLPDRAVLRRHLGMAGRKSARGALAVHPNALLLALDRVLLELGDVVADVVD